ncbi:MAG: CoA pyrophosphatase [bacterium]|nr:CoA pyrophosphatase [bacterium]
MSKTFQEFLTHRLTKTLPGEEAQNVMRPFPESYKNPTFKNFSPEDDSYRNSSVLVPILTYTEEPEVLLTLRTQGIKHGGQISFPGGGREGDESIEETALREAHEETGIIEVNVEVVGHLSTLYVDRSNNMVTPVVGFIHQEQEFCANPNEVDEIFSVPISKLSGEEFLKQELWSLRETKYVVPFWDVHSVPLWGATSMMLNELVVLYEEFMELAKNHQSG